MSETHSKAQADINAAHKAQQRIAHAGCLPLATSTSLQAEITEHLITIADLQSKIQDLKYNIEDFTITAACVERDLGNTDRKYVAARSDLSTTKIELFQATENLNRVSTELKDTKEDLQYQTSLVQSSFKENKSIYTQHRDQRSTIQELRATLKEALNKKASCTTTSTSCQTTMDIVALMGSAQLNPAEPKEDPPSQTSWADNMENAE